MDDFSVKCGDLLLDNVLKIKRGTFGGLRKAFYDEIKGLSG